MVNIPTCNMPRRPSEFENHPAGFPKDTYYRAFCTHVVDGDTIDVIIDLGFLKYAYETIRLEGVDTPETFRPKSPIEKAAGMAAKTFVESKVLNKQLKIETIKDRQTFGRFRAKVFFYEDGVWKSLSEESKQNGYDWSEK